MKKKRLSDFEKAVITHYYTTKNRKYKNQAEKIIQNSFESIEEAYDTIIAEELKNAFPPIIDRKNKFTFIDLFAGIGGFRLAMENLGGRCVFSSEWNSLARKTYFSNYGDIPFGDITDSEVKKMIPKKFDILCAGFPCQPFSRAGVSARVSLGQEHGFDHPTQGNLFFEIVKIIKDHEPNVVFLENVKNLKSHDSGNTFQIIRDMIEALGYSFYSEVINSSSVVPQSRERTYMVCFKDRETRFCFPELTGSPIPLRSILEENVPLNYTISDKLWNGHQLRTEKNLRRGAGFTAFLADLDKPSKTLVARYGKDGKECLIPQINKNPRMLTPRECARLQGFPEKFRLPSSNSASYKQFGNSVAVPVIQKIAENILYSFNKNKK